MTSPVVHCEAALERKPIAPAISPGRPTRPSGLAAIIDALPSSNRAVGRHPSQYRQDRAAALTNTCYLVDMPCGARPLAIRLGKRHPIRIATDQTPVLAQQRISDRIGFFVGYDGPADTRPHATQNVQRQALIRGFQHALVTDGICPEDAMKTCSDAGQPSRNRGLRKNSKSAGRGQIVLSPPRHNETYGVPAIDSVGASGTDDLRILPT
jgi:hypothetical protein